MKITISLRIHCDFVPRIKLKANKALSHKGIIERMTFKYDHL